MESAEDIGIRCLEFAKRFLQTAVVVDNEAYMGADLSDGPNGEIAIPDRHTLAPSQKDQNQSDHRLKHSLNARSVIESFSALGVICSVVGPTQSAMKVMRKADIVVLDWLLKDGNPEHALKLLHNLLTGEVDRNSLRLVAIYTGEARLDDIYKAVFSRLEENGLDPQENGGRAVISYRHGRVVLYAKSDVNLATHLKDRSIAEEKLPERLIDDFARMTEGLLPSIVLTSLTAVREGAHRVLDQFCTALDPAFLAHKACLSNPDDAERQIVHHVAEELRGLMDNAVAAQSPAGAKAVEGWIQRKQEGKAHFVFDSKPLDLGQTKTLANKGLEASALRNNAFKGLSAGFSGQDIGGLDERLAWIMSFRTVYNAPPPTLWLGSVVSEMEGDDERHLICMRPRCDCVRLEKKASFFFLPLVEPGNANKQLVVRLGDEFKRLGIKLDPAGWVLRQFKPSEGSRAVTATKKDPGSLFEFMDVCGERYRWRGELKAEYAQRIAQTFAESLSRVAVDESEWLRRMAKKGH